MVRRPGGLGVAAVNAVWVLLDRSSPSFDQASYLTVAIQYNQAVDAGGLDALPDTMTALDPARGPLYVLLLMPVMAVLGNDQASGLWLNALIAPVLYVAAGEVAWRLTRSCGDTVVAGTIVTDSSLRVRVEAVGDDTALAGIERLVAEAQASRSRAQVLADRAAALLFYVATASGMVTFVVWMLLGDTADAVERTVTVLVIACPHALGLAIPLVVVLSTAIAARAGILVKDRLALEAMREITTVLFDKTGTLTRGEHVVTDVVVDLDAGIDEADGLLALAGAVESDSEHPLARAIVRTARERTSLPVARDFRSVTGRGVEATVDGVPVAVGGPALLRERAARRAVGARRPCRHVEGPRRGRPLRDPRRAHHRRARARGRDPARVPRRGGVPPPPRCPGRDDHRRRPPGRRLGRGRARRRRGLRRGPPGGQGRRRGRAPGPGRAGGDGG